MNHYTILFTYQPVVGAANPTIVEPVLMLLRSLHLEVQYEACELIKDLMQYDVQHSLLKRLSGITKTYQG